MPPAIAAPAEAAFILRNVRKTYRASRIPKDQPFSECRLTPKPSGPDWRATCGSSPVCRAHCPKCWALHIRELTIPRGSMTAILGHSGSGKTTLLNLLALLDTPDADSGTFTLDAETERGEALSLRFRGGWRMASGEEIELHKARRLLFGFVFQSGYLMSNLSAERNVFLPLALAGGDMGAMRERAAKLLGAVGFTPGRDRALPRALSGGEYQRVAVARALAHNPPIVFADEPTGNLDPVTGAMTMDLLRHWREEDSRRTVLLVTHNIRHALDWCDRIVVLSGGEVTLDRPRSEVEGAEELEEALRPPLR